MNPLKAVYRVGRARHRPQCQLTQQMAGRGSLYQHLEALVQAVNAVTCSQMVGTCVCVGVGGGGMHVHVVCLHAAMSYV